MLENTLQSCAHDGVHFGSAASGTVEKNVFDLIGERIEGSIVLDGFLDHVGRVEVWIESHCLEVIHAHSFLVNQGPIAFSGTAVCNDDHGKKV